MPRFWSVIEPIPNHYLLIAAIIVATISDRHLVPTIQRLRERNFVYFNENPVSLRQNAVTNATRSKDSGDIFERLP